MNAKNIQRVTWPMWCLLNVCLFFGQPQAYVVLFVWVCMCFGLSVCLCDIMSHLKVPGLTHYEERRKQLRD